MKRSYNEWIVLIWGIRSSRVWLTQLHLYCSSQNFCNVCKYISLGRSCRLYLHGYICMMIGHAGKAMPNALMIYFDMF